MFLLMFPSLCEMVPDFTMQLQIPSITRMIILVSPSNFLKTALVESR